MTKTVVTLFEQFSAAVDGEVVTRYRSNKVQALLAFLIAEHTHSHSREALMALLWPDIAQKSAQVNLRKTLQRFRGLFPDLLISEKRTVRLNCELEDGEFSADTYTFDRLLQTNDQHRHHSLQACEECLARLQQAVTLYHGPFLHNFYLPDSSEFETWAAARREQYQRRALDALSILTKAQLQQTQYAAAQKLAQRQLDLDPLRESGHRQLMEALARDGKRDQAMAQFERCRQLLLDELAMTPTKRTVQLADQIATGEIDLTQPQTPAVRGYELLEKLGEGAYGVVHRAYQPLVNREVAVKIIKPQYANRPDFIRRFEAEAQTVARLEHPYILPLYDFWREADGAFLVMRYMRGGSLAETLASGEAWSVERTLRLVDQIGSALTASHQQGVVHRDLKPANILCDEDGNSYLADFGIARHILDKSHSTTPHLTTSPYYSSPEQLRGDVTTPQSDIYTFGYLLFELLTGQKPWPTASVGTLIQNHLKTILPTPSLLNPKLSKAIDGVLQKATAKVPADRFSTVPIFVASVRDALAGDRGAMSPHMLPSVAPIIEGNPYKGLRAFQEGDAELFYGRAELTNQLIANLQTAHPSGSDRFLAVVGPSGSGKSSVVKAGLIPQLRKNAVEGSAQWFIVEMVPSSHPFEELEAALLRIAIDPPERLLEPLQKDQRGLTRTLKRIMPPAEVNDGEPGQLLLVIDQFEELFTLVEDDDQRQLFINSLLAALNEPRSQLRIVLTLRADFYDRPLQIPELAKLVEAYTIVVRPLDSAELNQAITRPAALAGVRFEDGVVSRIIDDVRGEPGMLPLLQYALTELFEREESGVISAEAYTALGGVSGALGKRAESIYVNLDNDTQPLAKQMFLRLVTIGEGVEDTRRRVLQGELEALGSDNQQGDVTSLILHPFGTARLLSFDHDPITRAPTVEVAHEALLHKWDRFQLWLDESREDVRLQRLLATAVAEWHQADESPGYLLREGRLIQYEEWSTTTTVALTAEERAFVEASSSARAQHEAEEAARQQRELETAQALAETERQRAEEQAAASQNLRRRATFLGAALILSALLAGVALFASFRANNNAELAQENADLAVAREADALAAQAETEVERDRAEEQAKLASARELAAQANLTLEEDPELSLILAKESLNTAYTKEAETALHTALQSSFIRATYDLGYRNGLLSPNKKYLLGGNPQNFTIFDSTTMDPIFEGDGSYQLFLDDNHLLVDIFVEEIDGNEVWQQVVYSMESKGVVDFPIADQFTWVYDDTSQWDYDEKGLLLAASLLSGEILFWDLKTGKQFKTIQAYDTPISRLTFSNDGSLLLSSDFSGQVFIWDTTDLATTEEIALIDTFLAFDGNNNGGLAFEFNADNSKLFVFGDHIELRELNNLQQVVTRYIGLTSNAQSSILNKDESLLIAGDSNGKILIWDVQSGELKKTFSGHDGVAGVMGLIKDETKLVSMGQDFTTRIWDMSDFKQGETIAYEAVPFATGSRISPNGDYLGVVEVEGAAHILSRESGKIITSFGGIEKPSFRMDFNPNGAEIITIGTDDLIRKWDIDSGELLLEFEGHESDIFGSFFSGILDVDHTPDGKTFATGSSDGLVKLWDSKTGELIQTYEGYPGAINSVRISADGLYLIAGGEVVDEESRIFQGEVWVWDFETGQHLKTLGWVENQIWGLAVHPSKPIALVGGWAGDIKVWNIETGEELYRLTSQGGGIIWQPSFSPDGEYFVIGGSGDPAQVYKTSTGELVSVLTDYSFGGVQFTPDNTIISSSYSQEGEVREITVFLEDALALAEKRITRELTEQECLQYLRRADCVVETSEG